MEEDDLLHADGLDLAADGTLRVAHNAVNTLTRWHLSPGGTEARLTRTVTDPSLQIPTTLAHVPGRTLVVRSQFDKAAPWARAPLRPSRSPPSAVSEHVVRVGAGRPGQGPRPPADARSGPPGENGQVWRNPITEAARIH